MLNASIIVSMIATVTIAIYAWRSYELSKQIKIANDSKTQTDQEFRQQVSDLYQAIVVATIISTPNMIGQYSTVIDTFKAHYNGKTPIFKD